MLNIKKTLKNLLEKLKFKKNKNAKDIEFYDSKNTIIYWFNDIERYERKIKVAEENAKRIDELGWDIREEDKWKVEKIKKDLKIGEAYIDETRWDTSKEDKEI